MSLKYINPKKFPPSLYDIIKLKPSKLPIDGFARMFCTHCGLLNRAILCPPMLGQTYPQFKTITDSKRWFKESKKAYIYIWKNNGTRRWWYKKDAERFKYIDLVIRKGRSLKGCEASSSKYYQKLMRKIQNANRKRGYDAHVFVTGHCDLCTGPGKGVRCPNRGNPPCKMGGLVSLEATGINVYQLLKNLKVGYEYPVLNELTLVTMMIVR